MTSAFISDSSSLTMIGRLETDFLTRLQNQTSR